MKADQQRLAQVIDLNVSHLGHKGRGVKIDEQAGYKLIAEEVTLPAAVIRNSALENNLNWMQAFANHHNVALCPHGKTTMTPAFFLQQIQHGAWGITVATPAQVEVAVLSGVTKVIMANQLVGKANMALIAKLQESHDFDFYCCVDSKDNAQQLQEYFSKAVQQINVLIEFGVAGGRCGCRTKDQVFKLAQDIHDSSALNLSGIEVYEGVIHGDNAETKVRHFLNESLDMLQTLALNGLMMERPIITGAGSAWYDVVADVFANLTHCLAVIRPGCYAIHDTGIYLDAQNAVMQRASNNQGYACELGGDLTSALEVWAYVVSRPEPTKIVVGLGKRDVAFDAGLPIAERRYRDGTELSTNGFTSTAVMDQHTFMEVSADCDVKVGDMIAFSTSHPCLTFDKWRYIAVCDDEYVVSHWVETCF